MVNMKIFQIVLFILLGLAIFYSYKTLPKTAPNNQSPIPIANETEPSVNANTTNQDNGILDTAKSILKNNPKPTPPSVLLQSSYHIYETFNNCGPATLSMILKYYNIEKSQKEIAEVLRPYQHPRGDNDDKSVSFTEFNDYVNNLGLTGVYKVNGDVNILKRIIANNVPVVTRNWLNEKDTIGHFIILKGYNDKTQEFTFDDSYYGPNKTISYNTLLKLWQPFNYEYFFVTKPEKLDLAKQIVGEFDDKKLYENSIKRADEELEFDSNNIYPYFNKSTAYYHLGDYAKSIENFEKVESRLPNRMLWYQIEPIQSYYEVKNYNKALMLIDKTLKTDNRAFSELYYIRGQIFEKQNKIEEAKVEYKKALIYKKGYKLAQEALDRLNS